MAVPNCMEKYVATVAAHAPTWDIYVNGNAAGTVVSQTSPVSLGKAAANYRRLFMSFPCRGQWKTANLQIKFAGTPSANFTLVMLPCTAELAKMSGDDMSFTNVDHSATDGFDDANAQTNSGSDPGGNTDNAIRAEFALTTSMTGSVTTGTNLYNFTDTVSGSNINPTGSTLCAVLNRAELAAKEQGVTSFVIMLVASDELNTAASVSIALSEDADAVDRPYLSGTVYPSPFDGHIFETDINWGFAGGSTADATVMLGELNFNTGDVVFIESGTPAQFVAGTGYTTSTPIDISAMAAGDDPVIFDADVTVNVPGNEFRACATIQGVTTKGPRTLIPNTPEDLHGESQIDIYRGDSHEIVAWNDLAGFDDVEALQVQAATDARINSVVDANPGIVRSVRFHDGAYAFGQLTSGVIFSLETDGSGLASAGADSTYAKLQRDTDEVARTFRRKSGLATGKFFSDYVPSNHDPFHAQFKTANNSESNNAEVWARNTIIKHRACPTGLNGSTPVRAYKGEADGRYFARPWGNYLHLQLHPGFESLYGSTNAVPVTSPIRGDMQAVGDWTLGSTQFDFFFHATTGQLALNAAADPAEKFKNIVIDIHNITGGTAGFASEGFNYGRFGPESLGTGEWWDDVHPKLAEQAAAGFNIAVVIAHDHNWDWFFKDGVLYVWMPSPGEIGVGDSNSKGPYSSGFRGTTGQIIHRGAHAKDCAGWVELHSSLTSLTFKYFGTFIATSPFDFSTAALVTVRTDGALVDQVSIPQHGGESRRAWGKRPSGNRPWTNRPANRR